MTQVADLTAKNGKKARNNLSSFDASKIEAELFAIESETLGLDPSSKNKVVEKGVVDNTEKKLTEDNPKSEEPQPKEEYKPKERATNVVEFSPESSELLHRLSRNQSSPSSTPKPKINVPVKLNVGRGSISGFGIKPKVAETSKAGGAPANNSGQTKVDQAQPDVSVVAAKPLNLTSVAIGGLKKANEFNNYSLRNHKSSLQNQLEKKSLFERSIDGEDAGLQIYDHGVAPNSGIKRYNKVKRSHKMLGGVDQHNLGSGGVRRALMYKPVKILLPVIVLFSVSAYLMYTNMPSINLKFAESRAGIAVSRPTYSPAGFKLTGTPEAETGRVAMNFKKGDLSYSISQNISDWDSTALLENKVLKETDEYSAYTDRGLTIYVYDNKAVWVNQGKVNEIDSSSAKLEIEEMVRIAGSM